MRGTSSSRTKTTFVMLAAVALVLPICFSLLTSELPDGHDTSEYVVRQVEFHRNITEGNLFPQWAPDLVLGAGEPLFEFNPPMIYYIAEFWYLVGFNLILAMNLACVALAVASAIGMFLLGRLYFGTWGGWLAAAAFLYAPYFSVNLYVRGALAEFAAFPFYTFALYGFGAYAQRRKGGYLVLGAIAYAGVLFSHNAAALFFTPLLLAFMLLTARMSRSWSVLANQAFGWLLGLGLGACVWLPSLAERKYVSLDRLLRGYLRYSNHFVSPLQLLYSPWGYGLSGSGHQDGPSFALGWSHLLLAALVSAVAAKYRKSANWAWLCFFAAATAVFCFMMTTFSQWIWDRISLLQYVEFPWRMLGPVCVCIAMLIAPLGQLVQVLPRWRNGICAGALALLIVPNIWHNQPKSYAAVNLSELTPARISATGVEPTTAYEYLPQWVRRPIYNPQGFLIVAGDAEMQITGRAVTSWTGNVRATQPSVAELSINWFPGWTVFLDHQKVTAGPADSTGLIRFEIPPGTYRFEVMWKRTAARWLAQCISWISFLTLALIGGFGLRRHQTRSKGILLSKATRVGSKAAASSSART